MKREHVQLLHEILLVAGNHLFVVMIPFTFLGLFGFQTAYMVVWGGLIVIPFIFYALRVRVHASFPFALLHIAIVAVCAVLPYDNLVVRVMATVLGMVYMVISFYLRTHKEDPKDGAVHVIVPFVVGVALMFFQGKYGNAAWTGYYVYLVTGFYALYIVSYYVEKYLFFVAMNEKTAQKVPEKEIFTSGILYVLFFVAGSVICMLFGANITLLQRLLAALKNLTTLILSNIHFEEPVQMVPVAEGFGGMEQDKLPPVPEQEPWLIWEILEVAMYIMMAVGAVMLAGALVLGLIRLLLYGLGKGKKAKAITLVGETDIREKLTVQKKVRKQGSIVSRGSYRKRIRRVYEKTASKEKKQLVGEQELSFLKKLTARECCKVLDRDGLRTAYEKARYSDAECTREDLMQSKN